MTDSTRSGAELSYTFQPEALTVYARDSWCVVYDALAPFDPPIWEGDGGSTLAAFCRGVAYAAELVAGHA